MSNLCTIFEFIQTLSLEDDDINSMLKEIDQINRENTKIENQLEECDRQHVRLQIELYNLETIVSHNDITAFEKFQQTSKKIYNDTVDLKILIEKIDFTKILQCYHMEMETMCLKEWQPIQDCFVKILKWHEKMEQRFIVQEYRQAEIAYRQAEETYKNQQQTMRKSLKQSLKLINQAMKRRNDVIIVMIRGSKYLNEHKSKMNQLNEYQMYIEGLRQEKLNIENQLEQTHLKAFNPMLKLNSNCNLIPNLKSNTETCNFIMPKLPSFTDILKSFYQTDNNTNITAIENTTKFCVKSILHTSNSKQSITKKQTKNVRFKVQLEEYQEETTENVYNNETETEEGEEEIKKYKEEENVQEINDLQNYPEIEIVDLLTPGDDLNETFEETEKAEMASMLLKPKTDKNDINNKPLIEIQDCIIFKKPFPVEEVLKIQNKDKTISDKSAASCSKQYAGTNYLYHADTKKATNATKKKSFYKEFLNISPSSATFFNDAKDFLFTSNENNEDFKRSETLNEFEATNTTFETPDVLDFGSNESFTFDSDDKMMDDHNPVNMDFM